MDHVFYNLRRALRRLVRTPGFTVLAIATLALGIAAHVAIFSLIDTLFLKPLPVRAPERLVSVHQTRGGLGAFPMSFAEYVDVRDATTVFSGLAAHYPSAPLHLETGPTSRMVNGSVVSPSYFELLGIQPVHGRFFAPGGHPSSAEPAAVLSYRLWQSHFGGRLGVLGKTVEVNGSPVTVVGIAPPGFEGLRLGRPSSIWIPITAPSIGYRWCETLQRGCRYLELIGRLAGEHTLAQARLEARRIAANLHPPAAGKDIDRGLRVEPLRGVHPAARQHTRRLVGVLLAAVTLVVLIAAANLGGLLLARGLERRKEVAVRLALGASRRRLAELFLAETFWLAIAGGAAGLPLGAGLTRLVAALYPADVPLELALSPATFLYTAGLSLVVGLAVGTVPAIQSTRPRLVPALKQDGSPGDARRPRLLAALVVLQVALSFVLLAATGMLLRSIDYVHGAGTLDPSTVATLRLRPRLASYEPATAQAVSREIVERLGSLPEVVSVSLGQGLPLPWPYQGPYPARSTAGGDPSRPDAQVWINEVGPRFFATLGVPLLHGRDFADRDRPDTPAVVIVNRRLAETLWPGRRAVGQPLLLGEDRYDVIGVVDDVSYQDMTGDRVPQAFLAYWQNPENSDARLAVRTVGDAADLLPALRRIVREIDPGLPVTETETLRDRQADFLSPVHLASRVLAASGVAALLLSAIGLFGILALTVTRRTREIGIRTALGADRRRISRWIARDAGLLVAIAMGCGLLAAQLARPVLAHYLYGVSSGDPAVYLAAMAVLGLVAFLATWWPARRAGLLDPVEALGRP